MPVEPVSDWKSEMKSILQGCGGGENAFDLRESPSKVRQVPALSRKDPPMVRESRPRHASSLEEKVAALSGKLLEAVTLLESIVDDIEEN